MKISFVFLWLRKNKFADPYYPEFIASGIAAHTAHDCDFVCITDQVLEPTIWVFSGGLTIRAFPSISGFPKHQHCKLEAFRSDLELAPRAVLTDLDNFVVGDLDEMLAYDGRFGARSTFHPQSRPQPQLSWAHFDTAGCHFIWDRARQMGAGEIEAFAPVGLGRGDQLFVWKMLGEFDRFDQIYEGQLESWKWCYLTGRDGATDNVRVYFAHGQPKPSQLDWRVDGPVSPEAQSFVDAARAAGEPYPK